MPTTTVETPNLASLHTSEICALIAAAAVHICFGDSVPLSHPLPRKRLALLISIGYHHQSNKHWELDGTHKDVIAMKELLIDRFGYDEKDITILSDSEEGITPTKHNIMDHLHRFIRPDANADHLFMYCGHADQRKVVARVQTSDSNLEEDDLQEFIIPSDALGVSGDPKDSDKFEDAIIDENTISDVELRELLVKRMGPGNTLVAFFDTCHSETLLNLKHYRCNRVNSLTSSMRRVGRRAVVEPWNRFCHIIPQGNLLVVNLEKRRRKGRRLCTGFCPRAYEKGAPQVICVSACKDRQITIESPHGGLMTRAIIDLLEKNPTPTLQELARAAKSGADDACRSIKESFKNGNKMDYLLYRLQRIFCPSKVQPKLFDTQPEPQISSLRPLHMQTKLKIGR